MSDVQDITQPKDRSSDFLECDAGAAAIEFSLVAAPFIATLLVALQLFLMFTAQQLLETATEAAGRQILTGAVQSQNLTKAQFQTAVCAKIPALLKCSGVMVDVQTASSFDAANIGSPTLTYNAGGNVTNTWQFQPGNPGDIVILRAMYQWPMFNILGFSPVTQGNGTHLLLATAVFKNESYIQ